MSVLTQFREFFAELTKDDAGVGWINFSRGIDYSEGSEKQLNYLF